MAKLLINNDQAPNEAENQSAQAPQAPVTQMPGTPSLRHYYAASQTIGGREVGGFKLGGRTYSKVVGAKVSGANMAEADMNALKQFDKLSPSQQLQWGAQNAVPSKTIEAHKAAMPQAPTLPPSVLALPNQPDRAGPNPGVNVDQRFAAMGAADASRKAAVKQAVTMAHAAQVANPAATVDAARAVRDAALAKDGITDLGGGAKAMKNKYGSGFAAPMPEGPRQPGVIRDEKGTVDVATMMEGKGKLDAVPYVPPIAGTPFEKGLTAGSVRPQMQQQIATGIADLMPGADKRRVADRSREVKNYAARQVATYGSDLGDKIKTFASESQPGFTGPFTPSSLAGKPNAKPVVAANSTKPMQTLAEAAGFTKAEGNSYSDWNDGTQNLRPVSGIPVKEAMKKVVGGYNVEPSLTAEEAKQADAKKQQEAKDLEAARIEQWDNQLNEIRKYAADNGIPLSELTQRRYPSPIDGQDADLRPTPGLARIQQYFKPGGIAFKQHGTGRAVPWDELIQDVYQRATPNAPKSQHPSLGQLLQSALNNVVSRKS